MVRRLLALSALALATSVALLACSYGWDLPADAGADATTGSGDAASTTDGGATAEAAVEDANGVGCKTSSECQPGYQCFFSDSRCGKGVPGRCESTANALAAVCTGGISSGISTAKYCGCNGQTYNSACALIEAGTTLNADGCGAQAGYTQCGYVACETATSFCVERHSSSPPYGCGSWAGCGAKNCTCTSWQVACPNDSGVCSGNASGSTTVVCP